MLKNGYISRILLFALIALCTCIDPYSPGLAGYKSLLVVDGLITNENLSYTVKLSRTMQEQNPAPSKVTNALVFITDNESNKYYLRNIGNGRYSTDSLALTGSIGRTYTLHIETAEGEKYESDGCQLFPVPEIDSIYFEKDEELVNNQTEKVDGIRIYLDSRDGDKSQYYRWSFIETWKFKVPLPKRFDFAGENQFVPVAKVKQYCWKNRISDEVLIHSVVPGQNSHIRKEPIFFIGSGKSDRLMLQYSILVKQYSVSKNEFSFWNNLKKVNDRGGDIFASQPFPVISNIHNTGNPNEIVLGYFQVSAVSQKRINISFKDIVRLGLPFYTYSECERIEKDPDDYYVPYSPAMTWAQLNDMFTKNSDYYFIEPKYNSETNILEKLIFARPECANCELTGTLAKPDFWIDLK